MLNILWIHVFLFRTLEWLLWLTAMFSSLSIHVRILHNNLLYIKLLLHRQCFNKKQPLGFLVITLANENRFSKFWNWHIHKETVYLAVIETSINCVTTLPCEIWKFKIAVSLFPPQMLIICNKHFWKCALDNKFLKELTILLHNLYIRCRL